VVRERAFEFKVERAHSCGLGGLRPMSAIRSRRRWFHRFVPVLSRLLVAHEDVIASAGVQLYTAAGPLCRIVSDLKDAASRISSGIEADLSESCSAWQGRALRCDRSEDDRLLF
jgi:hypothetical protein